DQPLRLGGDGAEHQRALARARHTGEHGEPSLGELDADVLEIVDARPLHADQVMAIGKGSVRHAAIVPRDGWGYGAAGRVDRKAVEGAWRGLISGCQLGKPVELLSMQQGFAAL